MAQEDEYELIPTSPIRRIERRIEHLETGSSSSEVRKLIEQVMELVQSNQRIIDDVIKSNNDLRNEMSRVPAKLDQLVSSMNEFMELLKTAATEDTVSDISRDVMKPVVDRMGELVEQEKRAFETSQAMLTTLGVIDKRLKRLYIQGNPQSASSPESPPVPTPYRKEPAANYG